MEKKELLKYIGNISQTGYCRQYTLTEGLGRGMRAVDINTGSGLQYTVLPDRGMDISLAAYKGINLVYQTCNGEVNPSFYEPEGINWLRTFGAGLLTTCGLTYLGSPCTDKGEQLGLHGRYSAIPARQFSDLSGWGKNEYVLKVKGIAEECHLFGNKLRLEREITSFCGKNSIILTDTITNFGNKTSPFTILYHMNFGYPLLTEDTELLIDPLKTVPRDRDAEPGINEFRQFIKPQKDYHEQVFFHTMKGDNRNESNITVRNKNAGIAVHITINTKELPFVAQWKMMGIGEYVLGIEPSNVFCMSRDKLRDENKLPFLQPDESVTNSIRIDLESI